jgi:hypothetical protein
MGDVARDDQKLGLNAGECHRITGDDCYLLRLHLRSIDDLEDVERAARYARDAADRAQEAESLEYVLWAPTPAEEALERVEELRSPAQGNRRLEVDLLRTRGHI